MATALDVAPSSGHAQIHVTTLRACKALADLILHLNERAEDVVAPDDREFATKKRESSTSVVRARGTARRRA